MRVLGIETSCDETGVAIYDSEKGLVANALYSQIKLHQQYGGVVPELASRDHVKHIVSIVHAAFNEASLSKKDIDAVAYTAGPGLIGALLTGACFAKAFAMAQQIPALAIHHLEAHILAARLENPALTFPFIALLVSGGHTQLIEAKALGIYHLLGETHDDAVGEAFDKTAKLMGIPYPGGPALAKLADTCDLTPSLPPFPRPMTQKPGLDFSFSGLKTHARTTWESSTKDTTAKQDIARAFQTAIVETLLIKCGRALTQTGHKKLVVAGGVGANQALRDALYTMMDERQGTVYFPKPLYCTDNGAMVAFAGFLHLQQGEKDADLSLSIRARWPL